MQQYKVSIEAVPETTAPGDSPTPPTPAPATTPSVLPVSVSLPTLKAVAHTALASICASAVALATTWLNPISTVTPLTPEPTAAIAPMPAPPIPIQLPSPTVTATPIATGKLWATLIVSATAPTPSAQFAMQTALMQGKVLDAYDCAVYVYNDSNPKLVEKGMRALVQRVPCVIFQDVHPGDKYAPPAAPPLYPNSVDDIVAEAKRLRGIK